MALPLRERIIRFFSPKGGIWFISPGLIGGGEERIVSDLEEYARKVAHTIQAIEDITRAYGSGEQGIMESAYLRIQGGWEECETIRWGMYRRVAENHLFFPDSRGDMFALINRMSLILLAMKDPRIFLLPERPLTGDLKYSTEKISENCRQLGMVLSRSIEHLNRDPSLALDEIRRAEEYQKEISRWAERSWRRISDTKAEERDRQILTFIEYLMAVSHETLSAIFRVQEIAVKFV